jgi:hypothetical protein
MARAAALLLALSLSACVGPFSPSGPEEKALEDARRLWDRQQISSYRFVVQQVCFCGPSVRTPLAVVVEQGRVSAVTDAVTGAPVQPEPFIPITVDRLFAAIKDAIDRDAVRLDVRYDPQLGYPQEISIDFDERIADEEVTYLASALVRR